MSRREEDDDITEEEPARPWWLRGLRHLLEWAGALTVVALIWMVLGSLRAPDLPDQAPDFTLSTLSGESVTLSDLQGQVVVVNFWATWCGPCRMEIPTFSDFAQEHPDIPVLGIAVDGTVAKLRQAKSAMGIAYPVLVDDGTVQRLYGVDTLPTTVVVGPDGAVRTAHAGIMLRPQLDWATR